MTRLAGALMDPDDVVGTRGYTSPATSMEVGLLAPSALFYVDTRAVYGGSVRVPSGGTVFPGEFIVAGVGPTAATPQLADAGMVRANARRRALENVARQLEAETGHMSAIRRATAHPAFKMMLEAGPESASIALRRVASDHRPLWLLFLDRVFGAAGPTTLPDTVDGAARAWRRWGREHGYL